jgi:hypothetical protein
LDAWFERYGISKIQAKSDLNFYFESVLNWKPTHGVTGFVGTGSDGSRTWDVGFKEIWMDQIVQYPFGK